MMSLLAQPVEIATREGHRPLASVLNGSQKRVPELDGIRGLAVLLVLLFHIFQVEPAPQHPLLRLGYSATHFGHTGVDLFFVLSGLLITGILLDTGIRLASSSISMGGGRSGSFRFTMAF